MSTNGQARHSGPTVATSFAGLTHDAIELAELQARLFSLDVRNTSQKAGVSLAMVLCGLCVLLGTVPVALFALAELLVETLGWSRASAFGVSTLVGVLTSVGILAIAWSGFRTGILSMQRSRDELSKNIAWVKSNLRNRAQATPADKI